MRVTHRWWGALAATLCVAAGAGATPILLEGTSITALPSGLLGYDLAANDYSPGGVSAVSDADIEFLTSDFALALDFTSDGLLRLFDNAGSGTEVFSYTLQFSFAGLSGPLASVRLRDASCLVSGEVRFDILTGNSLELTLREVRFTPGFTFAAVALAVGEPPVAALLVLGMVMMLAGAVCPRAREVMP